MTNGVKDPGGVQAIQVWEDYIIKLVSIEKKGSFTGKHKRIFLMIIP